MFLRMRSQPNLEPSSTFDARAYSEYACVFLRKTSRYDPFTSNIAHHCVVLRMRIRFSTQMHAYASKRIRWESTLKAINRHENLCIYACTHFYTYSEMFRVIPCQAIKLHHFCMVSLFWPKQSAILCLFAAVKAIAAEAGAIGCTNCTTKMSHLQLQRYIASFCLS